MSAHIPHRLILAILSLGGFLLTDLAFSQEIALDSLVTKLDNGDVLVSYLPKVSPFQPIKYSSTTLDPYLRDSLLLSRPLDTLSLQKPVSNARQDLRSNPANYSVGAIPCTEGTTPTGARTYTIPIATCSVSSFAPSVALVYNSQAGDGIAGYGWSLSGLSEITISGKSIYYNGTTAAPLVTDLDAAFALDGVPIVQSTETALLSQYPYSTARGNIQISKHTTPSDSASYFTALYPDGSRATFGWQTTTKTSSSYPITLFEDIDGNKIVFNYFQSGGQYLPSAVKYDYIGGTPQGRITFTYSPRNSCTKYVAGEEYSQDKILSGINTYAKADSLLASYTLSHEQKHSAYLLSALEMSNGTGEFYPLGFEYDDPVLSPDFMNPIPMSLSTSFPSNIALRNVRGKFVPGEDSDGLISLPQYSNYTQTQVYYKKFLGRVIATYYEYGSEYAANQEIVIAPRIQQGASTFSVTAEEGFQTIEALDVDYDGTDEIVKVNSHGFVGDSTVLRIKTYRFNASASQLDSSCFDVNVIGKVVDGQFTSPQQRIYLWGRFGDTGHMQLVTVSYNTDFKGRSRTSYTSVIDLVTHAKTESQKFDLAKGEEYKLLAYDMDGDGKTDMCEALSYGLMKQRFSQNGYFVSDTLITGVSQNTIKDSYYIADMNGDGYPDIIIPPYNGYYYETYPGYDEGSGEDPAHYLVWEYASGGNNWDIYSFTGNSFVKRTCTAATRDIEDRFMFMDINYDGLADLIELNDSSMIIHPNENGVITANNRIVSGQSVSNNSDILPANVINFNRSSLFVTVHGNDVKAYEFLENRSLKRLIVQFEDSFGNVSFNSYLPATNADVYQKDPSVSYSAAEGFYVHTIPLNLLQHSHSYLNSLVLIAYCDYLYFNAVCSNQGLGFRGFGKTTVTDYYSGNRVTTILDHLKLGVPASSAAYKIGFSSPYSSASFTYDSHTTTYGKLNPRLTQSVAADYMTGITTTTSYTYGTYDLPTQIQTSRQIGSGTAQTVSVSRSYSNSVSVSKYLLGLVTDETQVTDATSGQMFHWQEMQVNSYDNKGHCIQSEKYVGLLFAGSLVSSVRRAYDSHGNVTSEKTAPYGATTFTGDTLVYDANGRYLLSKTDALGHTTTYSNYNKFGKPTTVTDYRNRSTTYTYDSWGNLTQVSHPDGGVEQTTAAWGGDGLYTVTQTATGSPETITHYDALGREIKSGVKRFDGVWQFTNKEYDSKGRLNRVSLPYRATTGVTGPTYWNTYHYDVYDRPDSLCEASGRRTRWSYSGTSTTTIKDGISITRTTDAMGRVVSTSDSGGTVTYALRDDGQPSSITAPGNVVTTFTYDSYGRRTQMVDPSLGTESDSYTWNADGSSVFTHINRNGTVATSKDRFGRVTYVSRQGEFNTTYTYDTYGRLSAVSSTNGTGKEYTYDAYDRVATFKETVPNNKWLQKTYTYSTGSVLSSIAYTSQSGYITTETYTYSNGHNTGITIPGTPSGTNKTVWSLVSENDLGQPTEITTGQQTREYGFNAFGLPTYRKIEGGYIQNFSYQFDPATGNLLGRSGYLGSAETFGYDNLNRLTSITKGNNTRQIVYQDNGNITSIDGVGSLIYGGGTGVSPYEVTGLTPEQGQPAHRQRSVTYNSFDRPAYVVENTMDYPEAHFTYNADGDRVFADIEYIDGHLHTQYYIGGRYEYDNPYGTATERLYLGGDAYSAPMVYQRSGNGSWTLYNIGRDYLGSITSISDESDGIIAVYRYDPWG
ncbi:MAG: hypothetical protein IK045_00145, partial [Bacteroidales bacterium]|nr:hypothetical protein [Bacteroidales bacterium]